MLAFSKDILATADGCQPSITIGTQRNNFKKYDLFNALQRDTDTTTNDETMLTMPSFDDEQEDDNDDNDDDGTRHYTTADGKKDISFKKNASQNGKL